MWESQQESAATSTPLTKQYPPLWGAVTLFDITVSGAGETHGEQGGRHARLASQVNPGDQRGDRRRSQITLTP